MLTTTRDAFCSMLMEEDDRRCLTDDSRIGYMLLGFEDGRKCFKTFFNTYLLKRILKHFVGMAKSCIVILMKERLFYTRS